MVTFRIFLHKSKMRARPTFAFTVAFALIVLCAQECSMFSIGITGDVNLNPLLPSDRDPSYVWGDMVGVLRAVDLMAIQHEGTIAEIKDDNPATIQFEDPLNYTHTYAAAGIDYITIANNHQYDFGFKGLQNTQATLEAMGIPFSGVGTSHASVRKPRVVHVPTSPSRQNVKSNNHNNHNNNNNNHNNDNNNTTTTNTNNNHNNNNNTTTTTNTNTIDANNDEVTGVDVAIFSLVVDECYRWPNGTVYLDGCTCGPSANPSHDPPYQCYAANDTMPGLWYQFGIDDALIAETSQIVSQYKQAHPTQLIVFYLHVGPNFLWSPYTEHENLLRNISAAGADLVWGTSSHHIQRFEVFRGKPIVYGLGDFLFRHVVGVEDWCPLYARPCVNYRPDLSLMYIFDVIVDPLNNNTPKINLDNITAYGTKHDDFQTERVNSTQDVEWLVAAFDKQSFGARLVSTDTSKPTAKFHVQVMH